MGIIERSDEIQTRNKHSQGKLGLDAMGRPARYANELVLTSDAPSRRCVDSSIRHELVTRECLDVGIGPCQF